MKSLKLVLLLGMATLLFSCSPYNKIIKRNPLTHKDSVNLAKVCNTVYPFDTTNHNTSTVYLPAKDSSSYYNAILDSLRAIKSKDSIIYQQQYKDTCTSALLLATMNYNRGFDIGYLEGKKDCTPDTLLRTITYTIKDNRELKIAQDREQTEYAARLTAENKASKRQTIEFYLIGFILLIFIAGYFLGRYLIKQKVNTVAD